MFVTFEGVEGAGKSTQIALAESWLRGLGREVLTTRQPGGCPLGLELRRILLDARNVRIVDASYLYIEPVLITEAQAQHLKVERGSPGLDVARLLVDQTGRVAVHARALFRGDRCRVLFSSREARALEAALAAV